MILATLLMALMALEKEQICFAAATAVFAVLANIGKTSQTESSSNQSQLVRLFLQPTSQRGLAA